MVLLKALMEAYVRVEKSPAELTVADGEAGRGIYFSLTRYPDMLSYYKKNSGSNARVIQAVPKAGARIVDLTGPENNTLIRFIKSEIDSLAGRMEGYIKPPVTRSNYQRFGRLIQDFLRAYHPDTDAYIVNHEAHGTTLPKGKQMVVLNADKFDFKDV